jgi:hypothetical protein
VSVDESGTPESLSDLYRGPLQDFIARRTKLVRATRAADPSAAAAIGKARKPPLSVWAIDQLAIDHQHVLAELLASAADASDAQRGIADQSETRESLMLAAGRFRDAVEAATRAAESMLREGGHASGDDTRRRIDATLHAAATARGEERMALWQGRLDHEVGPSGFGAVDTTNHDPPDLTAVLAPLRHVGAHGTSRPHVLPREGSDRGKREAAKREAAQRAAEKLTAAAERARDLATAKRRHADTLADEIRAAEADAAAAEQAASDAEQAADKACAGLDS